MSNREEPIEGTAEELGPDGDPTPPPGAALEPAAVPEDDSDAPQFPYDPAGTRPKVDPSALLPARLDDVPREPPGEDRLPEPHEAPGAVALGRREAPHAARFHFLLGALAAIGVAALAAFAVLFVAPVADPESEWSSWRPSARGLSGAEQIAEHVGASYRLPGGEQMVLVTAGPLRVADLPLTLALREPPEQGGEARLLRGDTVVYRLCGLGPRCAIASGKPSAERSLLLRREALELALYSFRYLKGTDHVVVFLPPSYVTVRDQVGRSAQPRQTQIDNQALFFRRDDVRPVLETPLRATLPTPPPPLDRIATAREAPVVDRLTTQGMFSFTFAQPNSDAQVFLVLEPFDPVEAARQARERERQQAQQAARAAEAAIGGSGAGE